jgi:protein-S-isoprenylcysteine O-methyltransferase Ste14
MQYRHAKDFEESRSQAKAIILGRALFLLSVILLIVGGIYVGQYKDAGSVSLGTRLVRAGYIAVVVLLTYLIGFQAFLWTRRKLLSRSSRTVSAQGSNDITLVRHTDTAAGSSGN